MVQIGIGRRLTAILAADVSRYSRLMHGDEAAAHGKLMTLLAFIRIGVVAATWL